MPWYNFDEQERWKTVPNFSLESDLGVSLSLNDFYYRSNPVLAFPPRVEAEFKTIELGSLTASLADIEQHDGRLIVIHRSEEPPPESENTHTPNGFRLLYDPLNRVREIFRSLLPGASAGPAMIFVLDRYGAPFAAYSAQDLTRKKLGSEIVDWLEFIELQCPE